MSNELAGQVALITGASKGIGEALALRYAKRGASLVLAARDEALLESVADRCRAAGGKAVAVMCDVGNDIDCKRAVDSAIANFGKLDTVINNAGATMWAKFEDIKDLSMLDKIMRVNYLGAAYMTHAALPHLRQTQGRIVGIASLTALTGVPTRSGYAASKHAMRGLFDSLRIELASSGVTVTMIYPGFVSTGIRENATGADGKVSKINPVKEGEVMSVDECADLAFAAIQSRKRQLVMTARGKLGVWLKVIAPGLVDRIAAKTIERGK